jgi:alkanesulfonate monooxygenase SsuD/methylene tetrahydromethanopterin reductase-like flavin-dependent oxidoreductase (luciferase family)
MRVVSTMIRISATSSPDGGLMDHITNFARQVEARGFPGVWIGDSLAAAGLRSTRSRS